MAMARGFGGDGRRGISCNRHILISRLYRMGDYWLWRSWGRFLSNSPGGVRTWVSSTLRRTNH